MKKFIFRILCVSALFVGVGAVVQKVSAIFKSDDKAVIILKKSRTAIGGETKIKMVKSLTANGKAISIFNIDGSEKSREGNFQMNIQLPNQMSKMVEMRFESDIKEKLENKQTDGNQTFIIKEDDDKSKITTDVRAEQSTKMEFGKLEKGESKERTNIDLVRTIYSLFFTAPENLNVSYFYDGEDTIDGTAAEIVECKIKNDSIAKLYLSKSSNLPLMMTYQDLSTPKIVEIRISPDMNADDAEGNAKAMTRKRSDDKIANYTVKFSDYRDVNGLQLPFKWVQTADGKTDQTVNIEKYEINPTNIEDKFKPQEIRIRTKKP